MPKAERGSAKDIANRMKAKGLQKLKFFCQMCNKQCRDENGFKCHLTSESHLRNMKLFCSNASGMLDGFSAEFEKNYLDTLYRRHRTKKMNANSVYQEVIQDKEHVHMNATKWATLTDFVQYLGKTGKCVVEETERGWYVTFIERDPTILAQQENYKRRVEAEKREEKKVAKRMEMQRIEAAKMMDRAGASVRVEASKMERKEDDAPLEIKLGGLGNGAGLKKNKSKTKNQAKSVFGGEEEDEDDDENQLEEQLLAQVNKPIHEVEKLANELQKKDRLREETKHKRRREDGTSTEESGQSNKRANTSKVKTDDDGLEDVRKKHWIRKDILTKIVSKKVKKGKYYKRKCVIIKVHDKYTAEVEILDSGPNANDGGAILEVDQDDLETVIPKVGKKVMIVNGKGRGMVAELLSVNEEKFRASLHVLDSDAVLKKVDFNDFSKLS